MNIKIVQSAKEKEGAFHVRTVVFIDEQKVAPEEEMDSYDNEAIHFVGYSSMDPIAASRLRFVDDFGKLERICILKQHRNKSYGSQMIHAMEKEASQHGYSKTKLNAQTHAEDFYKRLGYKTISGEFLDAGIPHITMVKQLNKKI